jgi:sucrose phosphorylase
MTIEQRIHDKLVTLYGAEQAPAVYEQIMQMVGERKAVPADRLRLSERDVMLIAYGDHVHRPGEHPLATLRAWLRALTLPLSSVHILPFYPYSSDDGFSVIDYYAVDEALGTWEDVRALAQDYRLMFDAVFNHVSAHSAWFQAFLRGEPPYVDYFVTATPDAEVSMVTRPRTHPLLTRFETNLGVRYVWTTFSDDQIDLNAANPDVLIALIKVLLFYVEQGAQYIRLDAIAFLWKEIGTTCIHLPNTHVVIQLLRDVLDAAAPETILITETNVPHQENLSYFGDGTNEAQLVYQFALPPLILHTLHTGDASRLNTWAKTIARVGERTTFLNFTASHDGIGVRPVKGILSDDEIAALVERTRAQGGYISMKSESDGSQTPYELNITYFDAITPPAVTAEDPSRAVARFVLSQAIMLAIIGVPAIYLPSLFGAGNYAAGVQATGRYRVINREKHDADALLRDLLSTAPDAGTRRAVFTRYQQLLEVRTREAAFHPLGTQTILDVDPAVFAIERIAPDHSDRVIALHNVSDRVITAALPPSVTGAWIDLIDRQAVDAAQPISLQPYQILWMKHIAHSPAPA